MTDPFEPNDPRYPRRDYLEGPDYAPETGHGADPNDTPHEDLDQPTMDPFSSGRTVWSQWGGMAPRWLRVGPPGFLFIPLAAMLGVWLDWWSVEPHGAALYTLVCMAAAAVWVNWASAPGQDIIAAVPIAVKFIIVAFGILILGIPGAFLAAWRVHRIKSAERPANPSR